MLMQALKAHSRWLSVAALLTALAGIAGTAVARIAKNTIDPPCGRVPGEESGERGVMIAACSTTTHSRINSASCSTKTGS